jgi:molybdopterin biosynthesis enzyme
MYAFDTNLGHADLFICTGGASAGTRDLLPDVISALGEVTTAKVAMKPGMPQIRGRIGGTPVIGLPGNPVSTFVSFEVFVRPALRKLQGRRDVARPSVTARATEPLRLARQAHLPAGAPGPRGGPLAGHPDGPAGLARDLLDRPRGRPRGGRRGRRGDRGRRRGPRPAAGRLMGG